MSQEDNRSFSLALADGIRAMRARYDGLPRGESAALRRCREAKNVALEGVYWRVAGTLGHEQRHLPHVALLFPLAQHHTSGHFAFGAFLRRQLGDKDGAALRFRRLLDSRDRDDLDHRLRRVLRLACADGARVDWGALGVDVLWFFAESDTVRRRWAQSFYAPGASSAASASVSND